MSESARPVTAQTYDVGDASRVPTINGEPIPWFISVEPGPMVEATADGSLHILWLPVFVNAPMPSPPEGRPAATHISEVSA